MLRVGLYVPAVEMASYAKIKKVNKCKYVACILTTNLILIVSVLIYHLWEFNFNKDSFIINFDFKLLIYLHWLSNIAKTETLLSTMFSSILCKVFSNTVHRFLRLHFYTFKGNYHAQWSFKYLNVYFFISGQILCILWNFM